MFIPRFTAVRVFSLINGTKPGYSKYDLAK